MKTFNCIVLSVIALCVLCVGCSFVFSDTPSNVASAEELPIFTFKYYDVTYDALRTTKFDDMYLDSSYSTMSIGGSTQYICADAVPFSAYDLLLFYLNKTDTSHIYITTVGPPSFTTGIQPVELTDFFVNNAAISLLTFTQDAFDDGFAAGRNDYEINTMPGLKADARQQGYDSGYSAGVTAGSDYSFFSLISAVVDAPLRVFKDMFTFEILGVDISSFLLSLFTLCLVVTVTKFLLAR